jgi:HK97 family phage portal protein
MSVSVRIRDAVRAWLMPEVRSSLENPATPLSYPAEWLLDIFNGGRTDSGIRVSEMTALQVSTVFACVQLISSAIGSLPLHVFEIVPQEGSDRPGKRVAYDHDDYDLLRWEPNPEMTAYTFRQTLQVHMLLWGNCYAEIQRDNANRPIALWPRNPAQTRASRLTGPMTVAGEKLEAGTLVYRTSDGLQDIVADPNEQPHPMAGERVVPADDMLHLPGLTLDGRVGQSVIQLSRQAVGLALATEKYGSKFFGNGARPGGVLTHPGKLTPESREVLKRSWQEAQGGENAHRAAVLEEGITWKEAATKPEEAQFLQTRDFQKHEICSIFRVPPHMIGETKSQNRANTEQIGLEFVTYSLGPWLESWTQELKRKLFPKVGRTAGRYFPKFETRALTMPDAESRRNFYATLRQWGLASADDIREMEDWNPIGGTVGTAILWPVNMQEAGSETPAEVEPSPDLPALPSEGDSQIESRLIRTYFRIFRDAMTRILARRVPDAEAFRRNFEPILASIAEQFDPSGAGRAEFEGYPFANYLDYLARQVQEWRLANGNLDQVVERELAGAIEAVRSALRENNLVIQS